MGATTKKEQRAIFGPEQRTQTKVGYIAIYGSGDCFGRTLADYPTLYEDRQDCEADSKEETGFIAIATVTWTEAI
jgi:hypothetical protein